MIDFELTPGCFQNANGLLPPPRGNSPRVLGVDIGGANLKFAYENQTARCRFPMWQQSQLLGDRLLSAMNTFAQEPEAVAITMTGELADCFTTRRAGVEHILAQVTCACPPGRIFVYSVDGQWMTPQIAKDHVWDVAASNWHALANWIARFGTSDASVDLVVDVGSTTVDVIPVSQGRVATPARTDRQRMQLGQLVYTGCERTPVAAITRQVMVAGVPCPLMAERFADSRDAYLALGHIGEDPTNLDTADGRGRTREYARNRLARMVGEDTDSLPTSEIESIALQIIATQAQAIATAVRRNLSNRVNGWQPTIVFCGHGDHLIDQIELNLGAEYARYVRLRDYLGVSASRNASAIAVAAQLEHAFASDSQA